MESEASLRTAGSFQEVKEKAKLDVMVLLG
jgi:hypothetical protein